MIYPVIFSIGSSSIHAHLVCEILAYSLGYRYYAYLRRHTVDPISESDRLWIFIGAAFGGFLGGHLVGIVERPDDWAKGLDWLYFMGNKTILGGLLGGLIGVEFTKKQIGVTASSGDLMTYPLIVGMVIGRIGCHLEGLEDGTYGLPTTLPWAMDFGDGIWRHPVNLYEILFLTALGVGLRWLERKHPLSMGSRFRLFMVGYLSWRFVLEYIKPAYFWSFGLSSIQVTVLMGLLYYRDVFFTPKKLFDRT
ncbi:MAG: prolipoprotein diacylglyceryl transferase [Saprospiraceae bacterium]|nr:prolipoprotein diacylglyceryl transferase [Saprospiraceae bacterium]